MDGLQKRLQTEVEKVKTVQKDLQKAVSAQQQFNGLLTQNTQVKEELDIIDDESTVYKMMGPVLIKQDLTEARSNVQKRIDYINGELKRQNGLIADLEKKHEGHQEAIAKMQHQFQQAKVKAAAKA